MSELLENEWQVFTDTSKQQMYIDYNKPVAISNIKREKANKGVINEKKKTIKKKKEKTKIESCSGECVSEKMVYESRKNHLQQNSVTGFSSEKNFCCC